MAGVFISFDLIGDATVSSALQTLASKSDNLTPALSDIGEYLLDVHEQRFVDQVTPDGNPWTALKPATLDRKKRKDRILREEGTLADQLTYQIGTNQMLFGTNLIYGATHQYGREDANIPAREWLGVNEQQEDPILNILRSYLLQ